MVNSHMLISVLTISWFVDVKTVDMKKISIFLLNEVEGFQLTGEKDADAIIAKLRELFPHARIMLTLGKDGAVYVDAQQKVFQPIGGISAANTLSQRSFSPLVTAPRTR